jgi:hypothetical protein
VSLTATVSDVTTDPRGSEDPPVDIVRVSLHGEALCVFTENTGKFRVGQQVEVEPIEPIDRHDNHTPRFRLIGA